jgi:hypothetical protein
MKTGNRNKLKNRYVNDENPALRKVVAGLKKLVKETAPRTRETVNAWGVPTFVANGPFALYMVSKKHVSFGFHFATSLPDPAGLLEGTGRNMRHVKLRSMDDLKKDGLRELIAAAAEFEGGAPMPGMEGKRRSR